MYIQERLSQIINSSTYNGILHAKNSRLICLDDEPEPEPEPATYQDQEIAFSSEYDEVEYNRNRNTGSSNTHHYNPSNH
jgi:hypothetical protein